MKETIVYLSGLGIEINEPALRAAIRSGDIKSPTITSKKDGLDIPISSIHEYALKKTNNTLIAYEIGRRQMREEYNLLLKSTINLNNFERNLKL